MEGEVFDDLRQFIDGAKKITDWKEIKGANWDLEISTLIEATAFGARTIIERIAEYGVPVESVVCAGGIAEKNALAMQIYADVTGCTIRIAGSSQACALGAAISATVIAAVYKDFPTAQAAMTSLKNIAYTPSPENQKAYDDLYRLYRALHDAFGGVNRNADLSTVMKELIAIKNKQNK